MLFTSLNFLPRWHDKKTFKKGWEGMNWLNFPFIFLNVYNKVTWTFWYLLHNVITMMSMAIQFYLAWQAMKDKQDIVMLILGWDVTPAKCDQTTLNCGYTLRSSECCLSIKTTYVWLNVGQRFRMLL